MKQFKSEILENIKISGRYFKLSFKTSGISKDIKPGQFLEIKINDGPRPFLRKPFSFHRLIRKGKKEAVEILYEVVGGGTRCLSEKKPGEYLDIIGPLGNGFDLEGPGQGSRVLIAGGIGVAPLLMLAEELVKHKTWNLEHRIIVLIGAKTKNKILCEREFKKLGASVMCATEDGSKGSRGFITGRLKSLLLTIDHRPSTIYACGPKAMLKETAKIAGRNKIPCQFLLEEYMACGVGVCLGCAVMTKNGYKMVCKDGPVFEASELVWE